MNLDDSLIPRGHHSTVVANVPELGPVAFLLWGHGNDFLPLSMTQLIFIDFQTCKNVLYIIFIEQSSTTSFI